ncbi:MAG: DUF2066 domain-containing protein [Magnetococcus sp. XQGC-1]
MNPASGVRVRGGRGCIGLLSIMLLGLLAGEASGNPAPFYQVTAESNVSLPMTDNQEPRAAAMEKAKKVAFDRLLHRMFTQADLDKNRPLLDSLGKEAKRLTERVRVVGEVQRGNKLQVTTEVTFSAKEIAAALAQKGISYNESPHPPVLFVVRTQGGPAEETASADQLLPRELQEEAKSLSLPVVTPLGDMDDMAHLTWDLVASGDPSVRQWATSRYAAGQVWGVSVQLTPLSGGDGKKTTAYTIQGQLLGGLTEQPGQPLPEPFRAEVTAPNPPGRCVERGDSRSCPYAVLARALVQKLSDHWILTHTINPALHHTANLRVLHGPKLAQFSQFVTKLRAIPGLTSLKFVEERATESTIQVAFQGQDAQLRTLLSQLGAQVEDGGLVSPPAAAGGSEAAPPRFDLLLRLP